MREVLIAAEGAWSEAKAKALDSLAVRRAHLERQLDDVRQIENWVRREIAGPSA